MDGLILIDKPPGLTSHDVVARIRNILSLQKVGHFGTLDPLATGLLLVAVGKATRLFPLYSKEDKRYSGRIRLGYSTDTYDALGKPSSEKKDNFPSRETLRQALLDFVGEKEQLPPPYSAKKLGGKPLYKWARSKKLPILKPFPVSIYVLEMKVYRPPFLDFETRCSSGTYIRSLAHELGQKLGCGAHLAELRRIEAGSFTIGESTLLEDVKMLADKGNIRQCLIPLESLLPEFQKVVLSQTGEQNLQRSKPVASESVLRILPSISQGISREDSGVTFRLFSLEGKLLGLARRDTEKKVLMPFLILR